MTTISHKPRNYSFCLDEEMYEFLVLPFVKVAAYAAGNFETQKTQSYTEVNELTSGPRKRLADLLSKETGSKIESKHLSVAELKVSLVRGSFYFKLLYMVKTGTVTENYAYNIRFTSGETALEKIRKIPQDTHAPCF